MKKTIMMAALVAVVCFLGACKKEGVYNPSEKLSKIYKASTNKAEYLDGSTWREAYNESTPKTLEESWTWDGKKLMSVSSHNSDGTVDPDEVITFTYDGKRLTKINSGSGAGNYAEIIYDGSVIDKIQAYTNSVLTTTVTFTYDGKKVSQITYTYAGEMEPFKAPQSFALLDFINNTFTPSNNENLTDMIRKDVSKGANSMTTTYTWDGKNISKESYSNGNFTATVDYTYDNKTNPFKGYVIDYLGETVLAASKNNVIKAVSTYTSEGRSESETTEYTYEYDGKWPVSRTHTYSSSEDNYRSSSTNITYYEYVD